MRRLFYLAALVLLSACMSACGGSRNREAVTEELPLDCVQVLYFHGKQRCVTCNAIERLTKEVVDSIGSDRILLRIVDITEDQALADRYEVAWSSLILVGNGRVEDLTKMGFGYARKQPQLFKAKLNEAIRKILE